MKKNSYILFNRNIIVLSFKLQYSSSYFFLNQIKRNLYIFPFFNLRIKYTVLYQIIFYPPNQIELKFLWIVLGL